MMRDPLDARIILPNGGVATPCMMLTPSECASWLADRREYSMRQEVAKYGPPPDPYGPDLFDMDIGTLFYVIVAYCMLAVFMSSVRKP